MCLISSVERASIGPGELMQNIATGGDSAELTLEAEC